MKPALQILFLIALLSLGASSFAQEPPEQPRHYDIEIIAFVRGDADAGGTEYWPLHSETPDWSQAASLQHPGTRKSEIVKLPASGHRLKREYLNLRATQGRLRPIIHLAWRQPLLSGDESTPIYIRSGDRDEKPAAVGEENLPELEGTVRVTGKRYLHVNLDLLLRQLTPPDLTTEVQSDDVGPTDFAPYYHTYRMVDHRRMRSDRLHYIDHPMLGVLILATPYEIPEPEAPETPVPAVPSAPIKTGDSGSPSGEASTPASGRAKPPAPSGGL